MGFGRKIYRLSIQQLPVGGVEVFGDDSPRDTVAADMVAGQQEDVPLFRMSQGGLEYGTVIQVNRVQLLRLAEAYKLSVADVTDDELPVTQDGTEHVMVDGQRLKGLSEQHGIDRSRASQCHGLVEMLRLGQVPQEERLLDRVGIDFSRDGSLGNLYIVLMAGSGSDGTDGPEPHHVGNLRDDAIATEPAHQADRLDGVASQGEEIIKGTDGGCEVQHLGEDLGNLLLCFSFRSDVFCITGHVGSRQLLPVNLSIGSERQLVQLYIGCRHHVIRQ